MKIVANYKCPICKATKTITDEHGQQQPPDTVICGWRGCAGTAVRYTPYKGFLVRMPEDLYEKVRTVAQEEDRSMASVIRRSIMNYVHYNWERK